MQEWLPEFRLRKARSWNMLYSQMSLQLVFCTSSQPYALLAVLPFGHHVVNRWTLFCRFPLTSGIIDWFRVEGIVRCHIVHLHAKSRVSTQSKPCCLELCPPQVLKASMGGDSTTYLFQCLSILKTQFAQFPFGDCPSNYSYVSNMNVKQL